MSVLTRRTKRQVPGRLEVKTSPPSDQEDVLLLYRSEARVTTVPFRRHKIRDTRSMPN